MTDVLDIPFPPPKEWVTQVPEWVPDTMGVAILTEGPEAGRFALVFDDEDSKVAHAPEFSSPHIDDHTAAPFYADTSKVYAGTEAHHGSVLTYSDGTQIRVGAVPVRHTDFAGKSLAAARAERQAANDDPDRQRGFGRIVNHYVKRADGTMKRLGVLIGSLTPGISRTEAAKLATSSNSGEWVPDVLRPGTYQHWGPAFVVNGAQRPVSAAHVYREDDCGPSVAVYESGAVVCTAEGCTPLPEPVEAAMTDIAPEMAPEAAPRGESVASSGEVAELRTDLARHADAVETLTALVTEIRQALDERMAAVELNLKQAELEQMSAGDSIDFGGMIDALTRRLDAMESAASGAESSGFAAQS